MCARACEVLICISIQALHVGRVKNYAVEGPGAIGQTAAIRACFYVAWNQIVFSEIHVPPKDAETIGNVRNSCALRDVKVKNLREYLCVIPKISGKRNLRRADSALDATAGDIFAEKNCLHGSHLFRLLTWS
jgi:hypothetical protein